ncbi:MAG: Lrp/AsnC family transcriptional regulator [Deltaproteobacteria bacterium]|nr:Lrp/AsnC family transcriptional regulator [Deltaproteobacteria bacterium]
MKFGEDTDIELDDIDLGILSVLQENCRTSLAKIGEQVGLSAPSVIERVKKLEDSGVIRGYHAILDARRLGMDITAFIGVYVSHPRSIGGFESEVETIEDVLECHHVTGSYTLLLKVKTPNTSSLEALISRLRSINGVEKTETMVVLSTHTERSRLKLPGAPARPLGVEAAPADKRARRNGHRLARG